MTNNCYSIYDSTTNRKDYRFVDKMPQYKEDYKAFIIRNFRQTGYENLQMRIYVTFVIDQNGNLIGERIDNKQNSDLTVSEIELLKLLKTMRNWEAGKCDNNPVPVIISLPIMIDYKNH
jgi:hypothetical protein